MIASRPVIAVVAVLFITATLVYSGLPDLLGLPRSFLWAMGVIGAVGLALWLREGGASESGAPARGEFLCDSCRFDDSRYCSRPERPNARSCPDYSRR